jgi:hypothetical protein
MKHSKSAMTAHHVQYGHMTMVTAAPARETEHGPVGRPRSYATDRFDRKPNGVPVPQQLRERIEASVRTNPNPEPNPPEMQTFLSKWGFLH